MCSSIVASNRYNDQLCIRRRRDMSEVALTREELYDLVWKRPIRDLAAELEMSDVGLAKLCRRNGIPIPPRGFHVRKPDYKKDKLVIPLPPIKSGWQSNFTFAKNVANGVKPKIDADIKLDEFSTKAQLDITPEQSRKIKATLKSIKQQIHLKKVDERGILKVPSLYFPVRVSPALYIRAVALLSHLLEKLLSMGASIEPYDPSDEKDRLGVLWEGYDFKIQIEEVSTRVEIPLEKRRKTSYPMVTDAWKLVPTNKLTLKVNGPGYGDITSRDGRRLIEERVDDVIRKMLVQTIEKREEERIRAERIKKSVVYLEGQDKKARAVEFQALRKKKLVQESRHWQRAEVMRSYVNAVEKAGQHDLQAFVSDEQKQEWIDWAHHYINTLCPIASGLAGELPPYPEPKEITEVPSYMLDYDDPEEAVANKNTRYWYYKDV